MEELGDNSTVILLSGGIDSTALIPYFLSKNCCVKCVHFQYGQKSQDSEREAVEKVSNYYKIDTKFINVGFEFSNIDGEYISRNALFILMAANLFQKDVSRIALGIHNGTPYYDCSKKFIRDCQKLIDGYFHGTVTIEAPFILHDKKQIFNYCLEKEVPVNLTYSCEIKNKIACGSCPSCKDRSLLNGLYSL
ncbi:7-cyano-7-deazaguanine synthase [Alkalihalobacillus sp. TS-13]|uniref:7-cyano-7-deazaguanine synthase n=1 Tax=Alkalihalobacillus sp. TS-13 TaxID=2842455 RepID=UPI001C88D1D5|nr:7-cyano-7-deazaguanine synthase [Alkalihalobacillus sp. TS-13]